ncbi:hypothetical protein NM688_g8395 [Phlebia brevispora]|uniref:Uncharacterized protein n=1 Tax=Phlebia brevispora TaxID=194682 RepID=A0ACC1RRV9_9APHY|nr:hypothetical protein NM688_g8395 [Phlebia brevispora]
MTVDSTITYPPPQTFPPPVPPLPSFKYSQPIPKTPTLYLMQSSIQPQPTASSSRTGSPVIQEPQIPAIHGLMPAEGRISPVTVQTYTSIDQISATSLQDGNSSQGGATKAMSTSASIQTLNSTTPLLQAFSRKDTIPEEADDPGRTSSASGTPGKDSRDSRPRRSSVTYSTNTSKSNFSSLIARVSHSSGGPDRRSLKQLSTSMFRRKPLPPVPPLPHIAVQDIRRQEDSLQLPDLVSRAQVLSQLLDKGHRPHHSMQSFGEPKGPEVAPVGTEEVIYSGVDPNLHHVLGIAAGVTAGKKSKHKCSGDLAGALCNLNATCICTTTIVSGQCKQLAQSLLDLVPSLNTIFDANMSATALSTALWEAQGTVLGSNCASQAELVDVGSALNPSASPNRTLWAQSALLWNLVQSENVTATTEMQQFVQSAPWSSLSAVDGPAVDSAGQFSTDVLGYQFDFAAQTVTPASATFEGAGQPSSGQLSEVNSVAEAVLDRMYTYAVASSTQQEKALQNYWTDVLQQKASDFENFVSLVRGAPVLLPFDSTLVMDGQSVASLMENSTTNPFPPPLACYPGLDDSQLQLLNSVETTVFNLSSASTVSSFDTSCYPNRPIYGVLDVLQLRLPFVNSLNGVATQAAVLKSAVSPRVVVYNGQILSTLPDASPSNTAVVDPHQYGTLNNMYHVLLRYLSSMDVNVATELAQFVLGSTTVPPSPSSALLSAISSLPVMEVAVFGTIKPSEIDHTVSSLTAPNGSLYFGTTASSNLREWTISAVQGDLLWTENATSTQYVKDDPSNPNFMQIWMSAYNYFHESNNATVTVSNITNSFESTGLFTNPSS